MKKQEQQQSTAEMWITRTTHTQTHSQTLARRLKTRKKRKKC